MTYLEKRFEEHGIKNLDNKKVEQFTKYMNLLQEYNKVMNLTAVDDEKGIVDRHFLDSIIPFKMIKSVNIDKNTNMIDIGSGAGFPGFPISIMTGANLIAIDALNKRICFLKEVIKGLSLESVDAFHMRAEEAGRMPKYRANFDIALSRAVSHLSMIMEFSIPFLKNSAHMIVLKSYSIENEIEESKNAFKLLNAEIVEDIPYFDASNIKRRVLVIRKKSSTSSIYPRRFSEIKKKRL